MIEMDELQQQSSKQGKMATTSQPVQPAEQHGDIMKLLFELKGQMNTIVPRLEQIETNLSVKIDNNKLGIQSLTNKVDSVQTELTEIRQKIVNNTNSINDLKNSIEVLSFNSDEIATTMDDCKKDIVE